MSRKVKTGLWTRGKHWFSESKPGYSFYRRSLPPGLIGLASTEGKRIFREGLEEGHCESFFSLVQQFVTQNEVSTCSSASMAMVLNALGVDPGRNWKGIWRWYDDYNIKHMHPAKVQEGLTLDQFNTLAQLNHTRSLAFSPLKDSKTTPPPFIKKSTLQLFRNCLIACTQRSNSLLTVNFHRKSLGQTGTGHYSPIGAYNAKRDMALILDVAKFKYDSYWCPVPHLYQALVPLDTVSQISRGFVINKKSIRIWRDWATQERESSPNGDLTQKMKQVQVREDNLIKILLNIFNKSTFHPLLVPILYEYATSEIINLDEIIEQIVKHQLPSLSTELESVMAHGLLNQEALILLQAFQRKSIITSLQTLALLLSTRSLHFFSTKVKHMKHHDSIHQFLLLFEVMHHYLRPQKKDPPPNETY